MKDKIINILKPIWKSGNKRHYLSLYLSGYLKNKKMKQDDVKYIIETLSDLSHDGKKYNRVLNVISTFQTKSSVGGYYKLKELLPNIVLKNLENLVDIKPVKIKFDDMKIIDISSFNHLEWITQNLLVI